MNSRVFKISALVVGIAVAFTIGFLARGPGEKSAVAVATPVKATQPADAPVPVAQFVEPKNVIENILDRLQKRLVTPSELLAFRKALLDGDPATMISEIRAFL